MQTYDGLENIFPEPIASGLYHAFAGADQITQLTFIMSLRGDTHQEIATELGMERTKVTKTIQIVKNEIRERVLPVYPSGFVF